MTAEPMIFDGQFGLEPFALFEVELTAPVVIDNDGPVARRFIPITGGRFSGEIEGTILAGGGDWQHVWPDRLELSAHYILKTTTGALIEVRSEGLRSGSPEVLARLAKGEVLDASQYYFRTAIRMTTGAPELAHLNGMLGIAMGARMPSGVTLRVFKVL